MNEEEVVQFFLTDPEKSMTEEEWVVCTSPEAILNCLGSGASERKLRLYAVNCCQRIAGLFKDDRCHHAINVAKLFCDQKRTAIELAAAGQVVAPIARIWGDVGSPLAQARYAVGGAAWAATRPSAWVAAWDAAYNARMAARDFMPRTNWELERAWQATLLVDLFSNPTQTYRMDPLWIHGDDGAAYRLARIIYDEGRFGDLPYLADALEYAGCTCTATLEHCRSRRPHYPGCWVVDSVLGYS